MRHRVLSLWALAWLLTSADAGAGAPVGRARLEGAIGPASVQYLERAVAEAEQLGAACLVVELDTPGGLDTSMRLIAKRILAAEVPVVIHVAPAGSRAASAGVFLAMAAHVCAMAPGTNIGAAHPVQIGGGPVDSTMGAKIGNDAAAFLRSLAQLRGRNADWAARAVLGSASLTAEEARRDGVSDITAETLAALLDSLDGRTVTLASGPRQLATAGAPVVAIAAGLREQLLARLSDPNVAYLLLLLGFYGVLFELYNPGSVLPGVVGGISLLLAFYAFQALPVRYAGIALVGLGLILFLLEIKVPSYGLLTTGGAISLLLGSAMLFDRRDPALRISWWVIVPAVAATAAFFTFAVGLGLRAQRRPALGGLEELVGKTGEARTAIVGDGTVFVNGEYWSAVGDGPIAAGQAVEVVAVVGARLHVRPAGPPARAG